MPYLYTNLSLLINLQFNASAEMSVAALTNCKRLLKSDGRLVLCPGIRALISRSKFPDHLAKASLSSCFTHSEGIMICEPQLSKNKSTDTIILEAIWLVKFCSPPTISRTNFLRCICILRTNSVPRSEQSPRTPIFCFDKFHCSKLAQP